MRKSRTLAGFDDVAGSNNNVNDNVSKNVNDNVIKEILGEQQQAKQLVGIYFEPELAEMLDRLAGKKRGAKSALVNEAVKRLFQEKGLI